MDAVKFWESVFSGATAGIVAGVVLAAIFEWVRRRRQGRERGEQILYLAGLINSFRLIIVDDNWPHRPDEPDEFFENAKRGIFRYMCETLDRSLDGRATQLTFDERDSLWRRISLYIGANGNLNVPRLTTEEMHSFFEGLDAIEWLELPKHRTPQPAHGGWPRWRLWLGR